MNEERAPRILLESCFALAVIFVACARSFGEFTFTVFQQRDIARALHAAAGQPIFFGPEMSGGGLLPGGFYYYLLAIPAAIGGTVSAMRIFQLLLYALAVLACWSFARRKLGFYPALLALASTLPSANLELQHRLDFLNPGFLPLLFILALWSLPYTFSREPGADRAWILFCVTGALGSQIHFSALLLMPTALLLQLSAHKLRLRRVPAPWFAGGIAIFLALLAPHVVWKTALLTNHPFGQMPFPSGANLRSNAWFAISSALGNYGLGPGSYLEAIRRVLWLAPAELLAAMMLSTIVRQTANDRSAAPTRFARDCRVVFAIATILFLPQALYFVIAKIYYRYTVGFAGAATALAVAWIAEARHQTRESLYPCLAATPLVIIATREIAALTNTQLAAAAAIVAVTLLALAAYFPQTGMAKKVPHTVALAAFVPFLWPIPLQEWRGEDRGGGRPTFAAQQAAAEIIYAGTGWNYEEARRRIFYVGVHNETALGQIYVDATRTITARPKGGIDGYFLALAYPPLPPANAGAFREFLLESTLPREVREGLLSGNLQIGAPATFHNFFVVPYSVVDPAQTPAYFHNRGEGYSAESVIQKPQPLLNAESMEASFSTCPDPSLCAITVRLEQRPVDKNEWQVQASLLAPALSQSSDWISPAWTEALWDSYWLYRCGKREERIPFAHALGFDPFHGRLQQTGTFLAPFTRLYRLRCPLPPHDFRFGFAKAAISRDGLPAYERSGKDVKLAHLRVGGERLSHDDKR